MAGTAIIAGHGVSLRVYRGALVVVDRDGRRTVIPLEDVDRVVIATSGVCVTSSAVRALARSGVGIVFLDGRGSPIVSLEPPWINATAETRLALYRARLEQRLGYAKSFVEAKLSNQAGFLEALAAKLGGMEAEALRGAAREVRRHLERARRAASTGDLREAEAGAARHYWKAYARLVPGKHGFPGRRPGARDPVNMALSYSYSLLYAEVFQALVVHGLDPYIGFMHELRSGSPSLVFDYSEMFRVSVVDSLVLYLLREQGWEPVVDGETGLLDRETRASLLEELAKWLRRRAVDSTGRAEELGRHIRLYARRFAQAVKGLAEYHGFVEVFRV